MTWDQSQLSHLLWNQFEPKTQPRQKSQIWDPDSAQNWSQTETFHETGPWWPSTYQILLVTSVGWTPTGNNADSVPITLAVEWVLKPEFETLGVILQPSDRFYFSDELWQSGRCKQKIFNVNLKLHFNSYLN